MQSTLSEPCHTKIQPGFLGGYERHRKSRCKEVVKAFGVEGTNLLHVGPTGANPPEYGPDSFEEKGGFFCRLEIGLGDDFH